MHESSWLQGSRAFVYNGFIIVNLINMVDEEKVESTETETEKAAEELPTTPEE